MQFNGALGSTPPPPPRNNSTYKCHDIYPHDPMARIICLYTNIVVALVYSRLYMPIDKLTKNKKKYTNSYVVICHKKEVSFVVFFLNTMNNDL